MFKAGFKESVLGGTGETKKLEIVAILSHRKEASLESMDVTVGKNNLTDKIYVLYYDEGDDENEKLMALLCKYAEYYEKHTKRFTLGSAKSNTRAGKIINPKQCST